MTRIEIPLSKTKLLFGVIGSFIFVAAGVFVYFYVSTLYVNSFAILCKVMSLLAVLFFGATGLYGILKMSDKHTGLTIDEEGITDHSNASSIGLVKWADIVKIQTRNVAGTKILLIYVSNPEAYQGRAAGMKLRLMASNNRAYGTPLSITANTLKCSSRDLERMLFEAFEAYKSSAGPTTAAKAH